MNDIATLRVPADVQQLERIRQFVSEHMAELGIDDAAAYDLVLAVNEMATNIIAHGYRSQSGAIAITLFVAGSDFVVVLRDQAPAFDPTSAPVPDIHTPLNRRRLGGMGIHITRESVDEMRYRVPPDGGNELTLVKRGVVLNRL